MSFEINSSDFTVIKNTSDWQPRPAIKEAMGHLCTVFSEAYPNAETGDTWVSFDNAVGRTTIFATPIDIMTPDGFHLLDRLVVKTVLPEGAWGLNNSLIVEANTMATTGALMVDPNTGDLVINGPSASGNLQ